MSIRHKNKPFNCTTPGCGRRFKSRPARDQHRRDVHGVNASQKPPLHGLPRNDIYDMVDAMDLPDGAHWAMIEELSGLEPGDFA